MLEAKEESVKPAKSSDKYKLAHSEILGRYFVAAKDLTPGEVILRESVVAVGPGAFNKNFMCFACLKLLPDVHLAKRFFSCSGCRVAIFCSSSCENEKLHHTTHECEAFRSNERLTELDKLPNIMEILLALRVWLLQKGNRDIWKIVLGMEAHLEERRDTAIWKNREINVIEVLRNFGLVPEESKNEPELLQRICGILDVNSFELRSPGGLEESPLRGIYPDTAIMAHDCIPNTHITVDNKFHLTVYACLPIKLDEPISFSYTSSLLCTEERREHLRQGKYFECDCSRCSDPTELGSNLSTLRCPRCKSGYVINKNPLRKNVYADRDSWHCQKCERSFSGKLIKSTLDLTKPLIDRTELTVKSLEELLKKLLCSYHPNHFFVISVKQKLLELYKKACACLNPDYATMKRMLEICRDLLFVFEIVEPGISRPKGILLWEMHLPMVLLADHDYTAGKITADQLVERLEDAGSYLKRSMTMLLLEPADTPEGFLARQAIEDFKSLRETLTQARRLKSSIKTKAGSSKGRQVI